jgi:putative serine protease PepD
MSLPPDPSSLPPLPDPDPTLGPWPARAPSAPPLREGWTSSPLPPPPAYPPGPPPPPPGEPGAPRSSSGRGWRVATGVLAATTLFSGGFAARALVDDEPEQPAPVAESLPTVPVDVAADEPVAAVADALSAAVVQIERTDGLGSGVVYDASGLILTNAHVVGRADVVDVVLADGTHQTGEVVGADASRDVAVVRIDDTDGLPVAPLALDEPATVGSLAVALGSPFGLEQTVTSGIVSALDRLVPGNDVNIGMIQTDASINPGNSGGPLANRAGEVIGINSSIFSETGQNSGIGFAIPIDIATETARRIVAGEDLEPARLGVEVGQSEEGDAGAVVEKVTRGSAAEEIGLEGGDRIIAVDGGAVKGANDLVVKISGHFPGDTVTLQVVRDGETIELDAVLGSDS